MKLTYPQMSYMFDTNIDSVNTLVIENQHLLCEFLIDINNQLIGNEGKTVLSDGGKSIPIHKNMELLTQFIPFEMNRKTLINKIVSSMVAKVQEPENYINNAELISQIEKLLFDLSFDLPCSIEFPKLSLENIIKSSNPEIQNDYSSLAEQIIDYFQIVTEMEGNKMFIMLNARCYLSDNEVEQLMAEVCKRRYNLIMIESSEYKMINKEKRYIIDKDMCEIGG